MTNKSASWFHQCVTNIEQGELFRLSCTVVNISLLFMYDLPPAMISVGYSNSSAVDIPLLLHGKMKDVSRHRNVPSYKERMGVERAERTCHLRESRERLRDSEREKGSGWVETEGILNLIVWTPSLSVSSSLHASCHFTVDHTDGLD
jgi:hypothetical protein